MIVITIFKLSLWQSYKNRRNMDWNSLSNETVVREMGERMKGQRINKRMTQQELAEKAGVSMFTIAQIERGKSVSLSMLVAVMRVLRLLDNLELLLPAPQLSPVALLKQQERVVRRVRRKKD